MADEEPKKNAKAGAKAGGKDYPQQIYAEDMSEEWAKDAVKAAR